MICNARTGRGNNTTRLNTLSGRISKHLNGGQCLDLTAVMHFISFTNGCSCLASIDVAYFHQGRRTVMIRMRLFLLGALTVAVDIPATTFAQWIPITPQYGANTWAVASEGTHVFAGMDNGIFLSTDNGASWSTTSLKNITVRVFYVTGNNVYAGTDTGVFVSSDSGKSWTSIGMPDTSVDAFCTMAGQLFAGTRGEGIFSTTDNGAAWKFAGLSGSTVNALAVDGTRILGSIALGGVFVSPDAGKTWNTSSSGLSTTSVGPLLVDGANVYLGSADGVFTSQDSGSAWVAPSFSWNYGQVTSLARSGGNLVAGTADSGIVYSTNGGSTWYTSNLRSWSNPWSSMPVQILSLAGSDTSLFAGASASGLNYANSRVSGVLRSTDNGATWTAQGLNSSRVWALLSDGNYLFQGTEGGVFRSTDDGYTWVSENAGLTLPLVSALAINDSGIYASTLTDYGGVFRSTDDGSSWSLTQLRGRQIYCLAANDSLLMAGGPAGGSYTGGLFISTSNGASWSTSINSSEESGINYVAIGDTNLFATDIGGHGLYLSADGGENWTIPNNGGFSSIAIIGRKVLAAAFFNSIGYLSTDNGRTWTQTATPGDVYALTVSGDTIYSATDHGIYGSTDNGESWGNLGATLQNTWFRSIAVHDGYLFAGTETGRIWRMPLSQVVISALHPPVLVSPTNGSTFLSDTVTCVWNSVPGASSYNFELAYDPSFTNVIDNTPSTSDTTAVLRGLAIGNLYYWRVMASSNSTLSNWSLPWSFRVAVDTSNRGKWMLAGLSSSGIQALVTEGGVLFAGTSSNGVLCSNDDGNRWTIVNSGLTCTDISALASYGSDLYAGTYSDSGGVYHSTNGGTSWSLTDLNGRQIYALAADGSYLLAGGPAGSYYSGGLFISSNKGASWTQSPIDFDEGAAGINSVAIQEPYFFATGLNDQGIFVSSNQGGNWTSQFGGSSVTIVGSDVYVGASDSPGGYLSTDDGTSWSHVGVNGPVDSTKALIASGNLLFAAVPYDHVYMSIDEGNTWSEVDSGLTENVTSFAISNGYIFAGTGNGHVWRMPLPDPSAISGSHQPHEASEYLLSQNYPNPFNPSTTISFDLKENSSVELQIYNVVGELVESFDEGKLAAGGYSFSVDMSRFASGVYLYRIEAHGQDGQTFISTRKMVLMK